jgi:polyisoprenoid-binding protein YceI
MTISAEADPTTGRTAWAVDPSHSRIGFSGRHLMISTVRGTFREFDVDFSVDESDPSSAQIEARIQTASLDTGNQQRDGHMRSGDFFDVENHPVMTFRSTGVEQTGDETFKVRGDLTIKGQARTVELEATYEGQAPGMDGKRHAAFTARTTVDRNDWGLSWNMPLGGDAVLVGNTIELLIDLTLIEETGEPA